MLNPRYANNLLDSCAFDGVDRQASEEILKLRDTGTVSVILAHSVLKEVEHPNTPEQVKREARDMVYTVETSLNAEEVKRRAAIHAILTGEGKPEKYAADAKHVFEAGKYGGYFITSDQRILNRRDDLRKVSGAFIVTPAEWLANFKATEGGL